MTRQPNQSFREAREAGFTLVEMLASLAILGMLAAMLLSGLQSVSQFVLKSREQGDRDTHVLAAQHVLRERLTLLWPQTRDDISEPRVDANGDETRFTFFAPPPAESQPAEQQRYRIQLSSQGELSLYSASGLNAAIDNEARSTIGWRQHVLLRDVKSIQFSYFGPDRLGLGRRWQTKWETRTQPPELVRLRVALQDGRTVWPELIVRPRAAITIACDPGISDSQCRSGQ